MTENPVTSRFTLSKLIYALSAVAVFTNLSSHYLFSVLEGRARFEEAVARLAEYAYPAEALITLVVLSGVLLAYRPPRTIFAWYPHEHSGWASIVLGMAVGAGLSAFAGLSGNSDARLERGLLSAALVPNPGRATAILSVLLVAAALPIIGEIFFRGVVLRTLAEHTTFPAAILGSSLLFAVLFVPLYGPITRLVFSLLAGSLFYRTRSLIGPILASVTLSCLLLTSVLYRMLIT